MKKENKIYLNDILDCVSKILMYIKGLDYQAFRKDNKTRDAVMRNFEIIGEAASQLSEDFIEEHHDLEFHRAIGMRNQLIHGYSKIDLKIIWRTIEDDLPSMEKAIKDLF